MVVEVALMVLMVVVGSYFGSDVWEVLPPDENQPDLRLACKHQRRKCYPDCVLARYFPAERTQEFLDVHRLFGVSNLMKFYNAVAPEYRRPLVDSLIYEARMRRENPVDGSVSVIRSLHQQIDATRREIEAVQSQIAFYQNQQHHQQQMQLPSAVNQGVAATGDDGTMNRGEGETSQPLDHLDESDPAKDPEIHEDSEA